MRLTLFFAFALLSHANEQDSAWDDGSLTLLQVKGQASDELESEDVEEIMDEDNDDEGIESTKEELEGKTEDDSWEAAWEAEADATEADEELAKYQEEHEFEDYDANYDESTASVPIGKKWKAGYCKGCVTGRSWTSLSQTVCNDRCYKSKSCDMFWFRDGHCGLCRKSKCRKTYNSGSTAGYTLYYKHVLKLPDRNKICKGKHSSQKRLKKPKGCDKRCKKNSKCVAAAYHGKSKQCRSWNKCVESIKKSGWQLMAR